MRTTSYSIVIPVHNEAVNLSGPFATFINWVNVHGPGVFGGLDNVEVVFAEDGSTDGTFAVLQRISRRFKCKVQIVHSEKRLGKGGGFKNGFFKAKNDVVILYDSDQSVSPNQLENLVEKMKEGHEIVIGCRNAPNSKILSFPPFIRYVYGKILYLLAKFLFFIPFKETQCGFKAFNRRRITPIIKEMVITGWLFDLEILLRAFYWNYNVSEIPVIYRFYKTSKIHTIKDPIKVLGDLINLRARILHYYLILPAWSRKLFPPMKKEKLNT
jgi:glycosyltransferase involved in cell wall biosynthesis